MPPPATDRNLQRRRFRPWALAGWGAVGALWALSFAFAFALSVVFMPVALVATVYMCLGYTRPEGWPGAIGGIGLVGFYLAYLHRSGPGEQCTRSAGTTTCVELLNPWVFLGGAIALLLVCAAVARWWYTRLITVRYRR